MRFSLLNGLSVCALFSLCSAFSPTFEFLRVLPRRFRSRLPDPLPPPLPLPLPLPLPFPLLPFAPRTLRMSTSRSSSCQTSPAALATPSAGAIAAADFGGTAAASGRACGCSSISVVVEPYVMAGSVAIEATSKVDIRRKFIWKRREQQKRID